MILNIMNNTDMATVSIASSETVEFVQFMSNTQGLYRGNLLNQKLKLL